MADNIKFLRGTQTKLDTLSTYTPGAFYLTTDSERLYYAHTSDKLSYLNKYITKVNTQNDLPVDDGTNAAKITDNNIGDFYYIETGNILCIYKGKNANPKWVQVNVDTPDTDTKVSAISISRSGKDTDSINYAYSLSQVDKGGTSIGTPLSGTFEISKADINALVTHQNVDVTVTGDKTDATDTKATIKTKLSGSNSEDSFSIEEGSNINIEVTDSTNSTIGNIKINAVDTTYDLSSAAGATTIILKENGSNQDTITFAAGTSNNDITVSGATANKIDIAHKTYNTKTASGVTDKTGVGNTGTFKVLKDVTVSNGHVTGVTTADITLNIPEDTNTYVTGVEADDEGIITITQEDGETVTSGKDLYYTINNTTYYNQADLTPALKTYIENNLSKVTNVMTFKGNTSTAPTLTNSSLGDVYIVTQDITVNTNETAKKGDMIIAFGTENSSTGKLNADGAKWIVVDGEEENTTYTIGSDATTIKLTASDGSDSGSIALSDDGYVDITGTNNTLKVTHKAYTARNITATSDTTLTHTSGDKTFKAITGFTSDSKGHVTGVTSTTYTLPQLPDQTNNHHFTTDSTNKKVILNNAADEAQDSIQFAAGTALSVAVATDSDQDKVTYSHSDVSCTHTNSTGSITDITGSAQNVISSITVNDQGHVTAYTTKRYKSTDTKYALSGATVAAVTNGVSITDTLKTTGGVAAGTSAFSIVSSNPTNLTVSGSGTEVSLGLVWGTF